MNQPDKSFWIENEDGYSIVPSKFVLDTCGFKLLKIPVYAKNNFEDPFTYITTVRMDQSLMVENSDFINKSEDFVITCLNVIKKQYDFNLVYLIIYTNSFIMFRGGKTNILEEYPCASKDFRIENFI